MLLCVREETMTTYGDLLIQSAHQCRRQSYTPAIEAEHAPEAADFVSVRFTRQKSMILPP